ncbi:hypothetical protein [Promicromonospora iranensis]|jgi:hypothetical protein|uniref:hypothetical protein n=1 Tax=Promicromonospora iranensis TaxID=1105144 RepID=UPI0023A9DAA2|nr:hypothetical protein [Promicromonospora iranensis]
MDDFRLVETFELEPDYEEIDRSRYSPIEDRAIEVMGRENRIGLALRSPVLVATGEPGRAAYDVGLMLVVHAHPECRFAWSRLVVDLSDTPEGIVEDMVPSEVQEEAVEMETRVGAGLTFSTVVNVVNVELGPEIAQKRTIYFPTVTASGTGFRKAYWDFMAKGGDYLHSNRELRLLVSAPAGTAVVASLTLRARLRLPGIQNLVPFRRKAAVDTRVQLV